jgi:hypothetical protein
MLCGYLRVIETLNLDDEVSSAMVSDSAWEDIVGDYDPSMAVNCELLGG